MTEWFSTQGIYLLRLFLAVVCGLCIGLERKNRGKEPGIRTHMLVSLAAAAMMIISKYGFFDVLHIANVGLDPSRVAAGLVTAIGFLGAGAIVVRRQTLVGLTTAAGLWATVGVGMAIGSGLYWLGIACTLLILLIQIIFHIDRGFLRARTAEHEFSFLLPDGTEGMEALRAFCSAHSMELTQLHAEKRPEGQLYLTAVLEVPKELTVWDLANLLRELPFVQSMTF